MIDSGEQSRQGRYQRRKHQEKAEVPGLPPVKDWDRRRACEFDLLLDLETYYPQSTGQNEFSQEQKDAIKRIEISLLEGDAKVLNAFPRGFGKTTISENAAIWGLKYGHCKYVPIIGADKPAATENIDSIKTEWMTNELLAEDFPEIALPFHHLENKAQRCASQAINGELTHIEWKADQIAAAWVKDKDGRYLPNSGGCVAARGLTGRIRGMKRKLPNGKQQRPDWWILDDPQTDGSARSPTQVESRMRLFRKAVLRLGGHNRLLAGVINATVIEVDDFVDQLLDHKKNPDVEGLRIKMLAARATEEADFWLGEYKRIRTTYNPEDPRDRKRAVAEATELYRRNRERADRGAKPTWIHCFAEEDGEISAIQHAYNILIDDGEEIFASECQNEPIRVTSGDHGFLSGSQMEELRTGKWTKNRLPTDCEAIAFSIDVQPSACLYYTILGASDSFNLYPIEYGVFPKQRTDTLRLSEIKRRNTIARKYPRIAKEKRIEFAVRDLIQDLSARSYKRRDGEVLSIRGGLVDAGNETAAVREGVTAAGINNIYVSFGRGYGVTDRPLMQLAMSKSERRSKDQFVPWQMTLTDQKKKTELTNRQVLYCTNSLKTFLHRRIATDFGAAGQFSLPKGAHRQFCGQVADSEYPVSGTGDYGEVLEWKQFKNEDNHLLDTTCGAIVALSIFGGVMYGSKPVPKKKKRRKAVSYL